MGAALLGLSKEREPFVNGGKGVCGKPGRVSCTMMIPIFQSFLKF